MAGYSLAESSDSRDRTRIMGSLPLASTFNLGAASPVPCEWIGSSKYLVVPCQ